MRDIREIAHLFEMRDKAMNDLREYSNARNWPVTEAEAAALSVMADQTLTAALFGKNIPESQKRAMRRDREVAKAGIIRDFEKRAP